MHKIEKQLIEEYYILDAPLTEFIISNWYNQIILEYELKRDIIRCIFDKCFETSFKHDLAYTKENKHYKYFIQDIEIVRIAEFYNVSISAWPFEGKIVCKDIEICVIPNQSVD